MPEPKPVLDIIRPDWPAPASVKAAVTTRQGGASAGPYAGLNLALQGGDNELDVAHNRQALRTELELPVEPQWLAQVHGRKVVQAQTDGWVRTADGSHTRSPGLACAVLTADCLPVLLCNRAGTQVAAAHAGWRGLAKGVLAAAVARFDDPSSELIAYLGPAISQRHFEVGVEVLETFFAATRNAEHAEQVAAAFAPSDRPLYFRADLYALARAELQALGLDAVYGGGFCTFSEADRFYSYRRDGTCGRMASLIWVAP